jgi:branched-chain amino acid transport system permease protein
MESRCRTPRRNVALVTLSTLFIQLLNGLAGASALFLLSAGLSLIFGVTRIVNFAHGSLMMLGAYLAYSLIGYLGGGAGYWGGVLVAVLLVAALGALIESQLLRRLYAAPELLQLLATFAIVLIVKDAVLAGWGPEDRLGPRAPGLRGAFALFGRAIPVYDVFLLVVGPCVLLALWWLIARTRFGVLVRAASENRVMAAALGVDERTLFTTVFALGAGLAGLAGALQLPREPANLGMDLATIADAFVVTVVGGLGSIPGAFIAALLISLLKSLCIALGTVDVAGVAIAFPKLTLVAEFVLMAIVLIVKPQGLLGRTPAAAAATATGEYRHGVRPVGRSVLVAGIVALCLAAVLPLVADEYTLVLATDILVFALTAASLRLLLGPGGMISFGHACYFGLGAYAAALALKGGMPMVSALSLAPLAAFAGALVFGWLCVRLSGVYMAMLTLSFAQITWSVAMQWDDVTGGSNGIVGVWPAAWLAGKQGYYLFTLGLAGAGIALLAWIAQTPFGYTLRAVRDSPLRAEALGIDSRGTQWLAFALAGGFAGLAGGLYAFSKGSISPETLSIPRSVEALVMVLLGGVDALAGPLVGAAALTWLQDTLPRATEFWRAALGAAILVLVLAFPAGIGGVVARLRPPRGTR